MSSKPSKKLFWIARTGKSIMFRFLSECLLRLVHDGRLLGEIFPIFDRYRAPLPIPPRYEPASRDPIIGSKK